MELNTTEEHHLELNEPHFDEEATVLSARPVVPLEELKTRETSKKRLALGAAMLFSVLVGALGATLVYKQRGQKEATAVVSTAKPEVEGSAGALDEAVSAEQAVAEAGTGNVPETEAPVVTKSEPQATVRKPVTAVSAREKTNSRVRSASQDERLADRDDDERQLRREQRIEGRQMRRRAAWEEMREARRRRNTSDDLLRIRDIFEGPRRRY